MMQAFKGNLRPWCKHPSVSRLVALPISESDHSRTAAINSIFIPSVTMCSQPFGSSAQDVHWVAGHQLASKRSHLLLRAPLVIGMSPSFFQVFANRCCSSNRLHCLSYGDTLGGVPDTEELSSLSAGHYGRERKWHRYRNVCDTKGFNVFGGLLWLDSGPRENLT